MAELVAITLERYIPPECLGCDTAYSLCFSMARRVLDSKVAVELVGEELTQLLADSCGGRVTRPSGWGNSSAECQYEESP